MTLHRSILQCLRVLSYYDLDSRLTPSCHTLYGAREYTHFVSQVKGVKGVKSVQRVVCGGCLDFKVVTALDVESFGAWEGEKFAPEEKFLEKVKGIKGVTQVETQTYTLMPM